MTIKEWISNPARSYKEGLAIYHRIKRNSGKDSFFNSVDNPPTGSLHYNLLFQAIKSAYRLMLSSDELDKTIVDAETKPITTQALSLDKRKFVLYDIVDVKSLPPDLQKLFFQNQDITRELSGLHQQLKSSGSDEQRKELAEKIVQLFDLRKANWQVLDNFSTGDQEDPGKESVADQQVVSAQEILAAERRMDTLRINISWVNKELLEKELSEAKIQVRQKKLLALQNEQQGLSNILGMS